MQKQMLIPSMTSKPIIAQPISFLRIRLAYSSRSRLLIQVLLTTYYIFVACFSIHLASFSIFFWSSSSAITFKSSSYSPHLISVLSLRLSLSRFLMQYEQRDQCLASLYRVTLWQSLEVLLWTECYHVWLVRCLIKSQYLPWVVGLSSTAYFCWATDLIVGYLTFDRSNVSTKAQTLAAFLDQSQEASDNKTAATSSSFQRYIILKMISEKLLSESIVTVFFVMAVAIKNYLKNQCVFLFFKQAIYYSLVIFFTGGDTVDTVLLGFTFTLRLSVEAEEILCLYMTLPAFAFESSCALMGSFFASPIEELSFSCEILWVLLNALEATG